MKYAFIDKSQLWHKTTFDMLPEIETSDDIQIYPIEYSPGIDEPIDQWMQLVIDGTNKEFIKHNNVRVVLFDLFEASKFVYTAAQLLNKHLQKKIYVITCDQLLPNQSTNDLHFIFHNFWSACMYPQNRPCKYFSNKLYINCTRVARPHRAQLIEELINNDLFDLGYNTISNKGNELTNYFSNNPTSKIPNQKFDVLDVSDLININPNNFVPTKQCKRSFVYIATETLVDNTRLFFSEKVYKPIAIGMPFMILGNPGTLKSLKQMGYKTFDKWFNEDYDNDINLSDRIKVITDNLNYYRNFTPCELTNIRSKMRPIIKHNQKVYRQQFVEFDAERLRPVIQGIINE
jgi:hypothetical protein